jgi:hypothetical protein
MPDFNGTGPEGKGPLTGRKRGKCRKSSNESDKKEEVKSFGFRRGRGNNGRGRRRRGEGPEQRPGD